jgi:hypothetical protein
MSHEEHAACIEACVRCAEECEHCADACLSEKIPIASSGKSGKGGPSASHRTRSAQNCDEHAM